MDSSEKVAYEFLRHRFRCETVCHEPNGNRIPDFLVSQRVAIEVRRLNQNVYDGSIRRGLEEISIPIDDMLRELLPKLGASCGDESWFVNFQIPPQQVRPDRGLKKKVWGVLKRFRDSTERCERSEKVLVLYDFPDTDFCLKVFRASKIHSSFFIFCPSQDRRRGGFVLSKIISNISVCVKEKTEKLRKSGMMDKYAEWWLVLVDHIDGDLNDREMEKLCWSIRVPPEWARIVVLNSNRSGKPVDIL